MSDSIGPASVRSDAYYLLSGLIERGGLEEILDGQAGVLLGLALGDLLREGWTILAPPPKVDMLEADDWTTICDTAQDSPAELKRKARWSW